MVFSSQLISVHWSKFMMSSHWCVCSFVLMELIGFFLNFTYIYMGIENNNLQWEIRREWTLKQDGTVIFQSHALESYPRQWRQANSSEIILSECSWSKLSSLIYHSWLDRTSLSRPLFSIGHSPFFIRPLIDGPILVG